MEFSPTRPRAFKIDEVDFHGALEMKEKQVDDLIFELQSKTGIGEWWDKLEQEGYFFSARFEGVKMMTELAISDFREKRDVSSAIVAVAMLKAFRDVCACLGRKRRAEKKKYQQEQSRKAYQEDRAAEIALWLESQETPPEAPISLAERRAALANRAEGPTP